jgi:ubiquinol-cytochrome c reductase iron-sulfur subunit
VSVATRRTADPTRRDFLYIATGSFAAVGAAAVAWPIIDQMNPDASIQALAAIEVDLSAIEVGQAVTVRWQGKPVFIRRRTQKEIDEARSATVADLPDPYARNDKLPANAPATDEDRAPRPEWIVVVGICTHLGCVPLGQKDGDPRGDWGGWFCPCHGSQYDTAGRIRKGPAPYNLEVPVYDFIEDTKIRIG